MSAPVEIPTVAELAALYDMQMKSPEFAEPLAELKRFADTSTGTALDYALATGGDEAADTIMKQHNWSAISHPFPCATNWHKDCSLIYYACWGNSHCPTGDLADLRLYHYLTTRDPECVFHTNPELGNMLDAWVYCPKHLPILKDLLEKGLDPSAKSRLDSRSPIESINEWISHGRKDDIIIAARDLMQEAIDRKKCLHRVKKDEAMQR